LLDMMTDFNPLTVTNVGGNGPDIVGSGATIFAEFPSSEVPEPATVLLLVFGLLSMGLVNRRRASVQSS
ncbi:MAG: PEP-CTERM sorting domain-containing protein, partial [Colwellia sp.]